MTRVPARLPVPPILVYLSYLSFFLLTTSTAMMLLPKSVVAKLPKPVRWMRAKLYSWLRRARELSRDGPFYKLTIWLGRKLGRGKLSSKCQAPDIRAKPTGSTEVQLSLTAHSPWNPFHEECYMLSWCRQDEGDSPFWREKLFDPSCDCEKLAAGKLKFVLEGLPESTPLRVRACGVNSRGRSPWAKDISVSTLAIPSEDNGFTGPAGPACSDVAQYTWTQTRTEVALRIPLRLEWTAKKLKVKWTPSRVEIRCESSTNGNGRSDEMLVGPLCKKIKNDEVFWTIEDTDNTYGRHLHFQMVKAEALEKWSCAIDAPGHPQIDTRALRFFDETSLDSLGDLSGLRGLS